MVLEQPGLAKIKSQQFKLDSLGMEWKTLMAECLMNTEISSKALCRDNPLILNPHYKMNVRHKLVKDGNFRRFPTFSMELMQTEAMQLLREESKKKLLKKKEQILVGSEIDKINKTFERYLCERDKQFRNFHNDKLKRLRSLIQKKVTQQRSQSEELTRDFLDVLETIRSLKCLTPKPEVRSKNGDMIASNRKILKNPDESNQNCTPSKRIESKCTVRSQNEFKNCENDICCPQIKWKNNSKEIELPLKLGDEPNNSLLNWDLRLIWTKWRNYTTKSLQKKKERIRYIRKIEQLMLRIEQVGSTESNSRVNSRKGNAIGECKTQVTVLEARWKVNSRMNKLEYARVYSRGTGNKGKRLNQNTETGNFFRNPGNVVSQQRPPRKKYVIPEFVKNLEKRNEERKKRWMDITERKQKMNEEREKRRLIAEKEAKAVEEAAVQKRLRNTKEKSKIKQIEEDKFKNQMKMAREHESRRLKYNSWKIWRNFVSLRQRQKNRAVQFNMMRLKRLCHVRWVQNVRQIRQFKKDLAEDIYHKNLTKFCFGEWKRWRQEGKEQMQVAIDWNDLKLTEKYFTKWWNFTWEEHLRNIRLKEKADANLERKIKEKYFAILKDFPKIMINDRRMERRKCLWRHKIQEILPDYRPLKATQEINQLTELLQ
ncbi:hypothetical protein RUM44_011840 [Polyplax serrata]|uniref:Uncharacterized protein n=1 Tax=Polyplax serrata TaxID=468196 RepID=A0ABR1BDJ8_POLSC